MEKENPQIDGLNVCLIMEVGIIRLIQSKYFNFTKHYWGFKILDKKK